MIEQEYILLIMNCQKYENKAKIQKLSWLPNIPNYFKYYHVIGNPNLESDFEFDEINNKLWIKVEDDYNSLPKKVIRAYIAIYKCFQFKYIFKTDDDQILINPKFFDIVKGITNGGNRIDYGGYIVDVPHNYLSKYHLIHPELPENLPVLKSKYCNGRFYFLSKLAIENIISKKVMIEKEYLEDYAIGYYLYPYYKINMINLFTNKFFIDVETSEYKHLLVI